MHFDPFRPGARIAWLGGRNTIWGGTRSLFMWIREGHGRTRKLSQSGSNEQGEDQKKGLHRNSEGFSAKIRNSISFSGRKQVISKKKRSSSQNFYKIQCEFAKITKIRVANTNLGLELHSSSPDPVRFFGAQSSLEGAQAVIWVGTAPECPPWRRVWIHLFYVFEEVVKFVSVLPAKNNLIVVGNNWIWCYVFE